MDSNNLFDYQSTNGRLIFLDYPEYLGLSTMAAAYEEAFNVLLNQLIKKGPKTFHPIDIIIYPILFLFRHCIEISLKDLIDNAEKLFQIKTENKLNHDFELIWARCKELLNRTETEYKFNSLLPNLKYCHTIEFIESIVMEVDDADKTSQSFRYAVGKNKKSLLTKLDFIDINHINETANRLFNDLKALNLAILLFKK